MTYPRVVLNFFAEIKDLGENFGPEKLTVFRDVLVKSYDRVYLTSQL
jgi:hypothetical protein